MKKPINEIAKLKRLAGLITESEYQETMMKDEAKVEEEVQLKQKQYYQIYDAGMDEWHDGYQYIGKVSGGSSAGKVGEYMFMYPDAPGSFSFVSIDDVYLNDMVKPSMNEGKEKVEEISSEAFKRMDGLVNRNHILSLLAAAEGIMGDLDAEGFDVEDIRDYINQIIVNDI